MLEISWDFMAERLSPLINYFDLNTQRGIVAIAWTIRQAGTISYPDLYHEVFGQSISQAEEGFLTPTINLQQVLAFYNVLTQLYQNGIIETTTPIPPEDVTSIFQHYDPGTEIEIILQVSPRVGFIQHLFGISLTEIVRKGRPLKSYPIFGDPIGDFDESDVFVIMPFRSEFQDVYTEAIQPAVDNTGLTVRRGDDFFSGQRIMDEVWSSIFHCKLCIVECTGHNPNVFYELGIAHMLGKPSIMILRDGSDIPFDIRDRRIILYQDGADGFKDLRKTLRKTIEAEMDSHYG